MKHVLYEVGSDESDEDDSEVEEEEWNENWTPGTINRPSQMWLDWLSGYCHPQSSVVTPSEHWSFQKGVL